jgi:hypothetical protein
MKYTLGLIFGVGFGYVLACNSLPSTVVERKINWAPALKCGEWLRDDGAPAEEPKLLAVEAKNDMFLKDGHHQSCFTTEDITKIESRIAELETALKQCQGGQNAKN